MDSRQRLKDLTDAVYDADGRVDETRLAWRVAPSRFSLLVLVGVLVLITALSLVSRRASPGEFIDEVASGPATQSGEHDNEPEAPVQADPVVVHVSGAVVAPGIVLLDEGQRVADAVTAAGGAAPEAQLDAVNLARVPADGEQIHVPAAGEATTAAPGAASQGGDPATAACIDLNTADEKALQELDGIGPALAARIVSHRDTAGLFERLDDVDAVPGIGTTLLARLESGTCPL